LATTDAIAFFGDTIVSLLQNGLNSLSPTPGVLLSTADDFKNSPPTPPAVTIFLYHVAIASEMRNTPRRPSGNGVSSSRPALPLELRFLVTPWTSTPRDSYRIAGVIAQLFYDNAVLSSSELLGNNVWAPDDTVEIVMESLPVAELYDIWDPTDIPYKFSLTYLARIIGIDSAVSTIGPFVTSATFSKANP
jgi:hypothetical protein